MEAPHSVRIPQQKRSIDRKEKILEVAYNLFCEKGYYETSIPDIARVASVPVGSVYAYFRDKEDLFDEVHRRFTARFDAVRDAAVPPAERGLNALTDYLRQTIISLVEVHEATKAFNVELKQLAYTNAKVAESAEAQAAKARAAILEQFALYEGVITVLDPEAAALVVTELVSALVDRIVFGPCSLDRERIIGEGIRALVLYLGGTIASSP